jgi:dihydroflavonol-4-reductase
MKVVVTGGAGFVGHHVVRLLRERGDEVRVVLAPGESPDPVARLDVESMHADLRDLPALDRAMQGADRVIHTAAIYSLWMRDWQPIYQVNVQGTANLLEACRRADVERIVCTSSVAAVGLRDDGTPSDETDAFNLHGAVPHYSLSKARAEQVALKAAEDGLPVVVVNPAFVFGAGDRRPTPTGRMILRILSGRWFATGPGGLNVVDVEDVARGHLLALDRGEIGRRYLLAGTNTTYEDLFRTVKDIAGSRRPHLRFPAWATRTSGRLGDLIGRVREPIIDSHTAEYACLTLHFDPSRARRELGYTVAPLEESLRRSIDWFAQADMLPG